ncbi:MAG: hypothetical protein EHM91_12690 [Planctomycetota bacterium]|nr:MAG: hypothetical protein EHM91_12690 [Planctomycetota bacterium]
MSLWKIALCLGFALSGAVSAQEGEKKAAIPCDVAAAEDAAWCPKCKKFREAAQLDGEKCKECATPTEKIKACVKKWIPRCGMHNQGPHLDNCCKSKFCCKMETLKSPVGFKCAGCGAFAREEAAIPHDPKPHEKKAVKACEASGTQPHGGEPIK